MKNFINDLPQQQKKILQGSRSVLIILGILQIILGMIGLSSPWMFSKAITEIIAVLFIITGVIQFFQVFHSHFIDKKKSAFDILIAILYIVAGIFMIKNPAAAVLTLTLIIGWFFTIKGAFLFVVAFRSPANKLWLFFNAAVTLILGILILSDISKDAPWILGILVGVNLIITGWTAFMFGFAIPKE